MRIQLKHSTSGVFKEVKMGFSWTSLFFGCLVPLFRGDFLWTILYIIITPVTFFTFWLVFPFIYNRIYIKGLLEKGYFPSNELSKNALVSKGWLLANSGQIPIQERSPSSPLEKSVDVNKSEVTASGADMSNLEAFISQICARHPSVKKSWIGAKVPADKKTKIINKIAPTIHQSGETMYFLCSFNLNGTSGIVITNTHIHLQVLRGFIGWPKKYQFPISEIKSIEAKSTWTHAVYGGGSYGPEFTVNGILIGWMQGVPDEDEKLVLELINEINSSGILLTK